MSASKIAAFVVMFVFGAVSVVGGMYAAGLDPLSRLEIVVEEAPPPPIEGLTERQTVEAIRLTVRREIQSVLPRAVEERVLAAVEARVTASVRDSIEETLRTTVREILREELAALEGRQETDPGEQETGPGEQEAGPGEQETDPGEQEADPGEQETDPGEQETGPGEQETGPGEQETGPGEQETGPGEQETDPGEQETGPGEQETGPGGGGEDPFAGNFFPPGDLHPRSGIGGSNRGYQGDFEVAGMRFPLEASPAFANSQVFGVGGARGPRGGQCDPRNFSYPWRDNFCEARRYSTSFCPGGRGHQGQDIRPATCDDDTHWAVAAEAGRITSLGTYTVTLMGESGHEYRYMHLSMNQLAVRRGQQVERGQRLGLVSNDFGGTPTTYHLHFEIRRVVRSADGRVRRQVMPVYLSLVNSYRRLLLEEKAANAE